MEGETLSELEMRFSASGKLSGLGKHVATPLSLLGKTAEFSQPKVGEVHGSFPGLRQHGTVINTEETC